MPIPLVAHSRAEEAEVYPVAKPEAGEVVHSQAEQLGQAFVDSRAQHLGDRPGTASKQELLTQAATPACPASPR